MATLGTSVATSCFEITIFLTNIVLESTIVESHNELPLNQAILIENYKLYKRGPRPRERKRKKNECQAEAISAHELQDVEAP